MRPDALGDFTGHLTHQLVHCGEMNGNAGMLDRARIEQRHHQIDVVVRPLDVERRAVLPAIPDRANRTHILAHPRPGGRPGHAEASLDMGLHLRAEAEGKAAAGELLQRPRAHRGHGRTAGKGNRDRRAELQGPRRLGRQRQQDERIVLGFLDDQPVIADFFQQARVAGDGMEIEWQFGRAQAGIDLAQRQECFKQHAVTPRSTAAALYHANASGQAVARIRHLPLCPRLDRPLSEGTAGEKTRIRSERWQHKKPGHYPECSSGMLPLRSRTSRRR